MGFWKKLFSGSNQPNKDESVGVDPTTGEKMKPKGPEDLKPRQGAGFSGRTEETKAQRNTDPETRKTVSEGEIYPNTNPHNSAVDASAIGKEEKTPEEKRATQPKPATEQKTTPKEAEPGTGMPKAGQHTRKDE